MLLTACTGTPFASICPAEEVEEPVALPVVDRVWGWVGARGRPFS